MDEAAPFLQTSRPASGHSMSSHTTANKHASNHKLGDFSKLRLVLSTDSTIYTQPSSPSRTPESSPLSSLSSSIPSVATCVQALTGTRSSSPSRTQSHVDASRNLHTSSRNTHVQHPPPTSLGNFTSILDSLEAPVSRKDRYSPDLPPSTTIATIAHTLSSSSSSSTFHPTSLTQGKDDMAVLNYATEHMLTIRVQAHSPNPFLSPAGQKVVANGCAKSLFRSYGGAQQNVKDTSSSPATSGTSSSSESDHPTTPATSLCGSPNDKYVPSYAVKTPKGPKSASFRWPRFVTLKPGPPRSTQHMSLQQKLIKHSLDDNLTGRHHSAIAKNGVYIFLDTSNIQISYTQAIKDSLGVDRAVPIKPTPTLDMEFLTKIMVRDRSVKVKRAGCSYRPDKPHPPVVRELQKLNYDVDVRPRRFVQDDKHHQPSAGSLARRDCHCSCHRHHRHHRHHSHHCSNESDTEVGSGRYAEDLVDETLQNRMYESLTENLAEPATLVLATGDGKPAQFSDGFFAVADRALKAGWNIELVSWKLSLSSAWRDPTWTAKWGDRFRVILLDSFLDELYPSRESFST